MSEWDELTAPAAPEGEASSWDEVTFKPAAPPPDYLMRPTQKPPQEAPRETTWGEFAGGLATDLGIGAMRATKSIPDLASFVLPDKWTDPWSEFFERGIESAEWLKPEAYKKEAERTFINRETGDFQTPSAEALLGTGIQSVPMVPFFLAGGGGTAAALRSTKALANAGKGAELFGYGLTNAAMVAPDQWRQTYKDALEGDPNSGRPPMSEDEAQRRADWAASWTAAMTQLTGTAGGAVAQKLGAESSNLVKAVLKGFFGEAPFEGGEEAGQQVISDLALGQPIDTLAALDVGLLAGTSGGAPGAGVAGLEYLGKPRQSAAPPDVPPTEPPAPPPVRPDIPQPTVVDPVEEARAKIASMAAANPVVAAMQQAEAAQTAPVRESQPVQQEPTPVQESTEPVQAEEEVPFHEWPDQPLPPKPPTLLESLAAGKVRLDRSKFGGDLLSGKDNIQVGNKWLFESPKLAADGKGMGPEQLLEWMVQEGYMPEPDPNTPTQQSVNDAVNLLNDAITGVVEVRSVNDDVAWADYDDAVRYNEELEMARLEAEESIPGSKWEDLAPALDEAYQYPPDLTDAEVDALAEQYASREDENVDQGTEEADVSEGLGIPEATPQETNQAAEQAKTAERNRLGEDVVPVESGPGELFAGNEPGVRPEQADLVEQQREDNRNIDHTVAGENVDVIVYNKGGGTFWVEATDIDSGQKIEIRKFQGENAKQRAIDHANKFEEPAAPDTVESLMEQAANSTDVINKYKEVKGKPNQLTTLTFAQSKDGNIQVQRTENAVTGRVTHTFWRGSQRIGKTKAAEILAGSKNKIVTDEAADAARDRLKSKLGTVRSGVDPEMYKDMLILAGYHVEKGARTAAALAKALIHEFPNLAKWINENAERLWNDVNQQEKVARTPPKPPPQQPAAPQAAKGPYRPTGPTSTKNAARDAERAARQADPIYSEYFKSNPDVVADAEQAMADNPNLAEEVIEDLLTNQYPSISRLTEAILVIYKTDVRRAMREQADRMLDENASQSARNIATAKYEDLLLRNNEIDLATSSSGAVWGGIGQFRKRWMEQDYTFVAQVAETARLIGQKPSKQQEAVIKQLTDRIAELETEVERVNRKAQDAIDKHHSQATIDAIYKESQKQAKIPRGKRIDAAIQAELAAIRAGAFGTFGAGIPAAQLAHLAKLGGLLIAKGANTFAKWTQAMRDALGAKIFGHVEGSLKELWEMALDEHLAIEAELSTDTVETLTAEAEALAEAQEPISHAVVYKLARAFVLQGMKTENEVMAAVTGVIQEFYPDISEREVRQIFSQYGQAKYPSQAADKKTLRELRVLVRLQESIERLQEGLDPKRTGPQRDKATQEIREKQKVLNSLMRKRALENPIPSKEKLASIDEQRITRLQNQIADLEKQLATGQKPVKGEPVPDSEAVTRLKAKRDALKKRIKEIEDAQKIKPTPEEKYNELRAKQLRKQLAEVARRIRENDYTPKQRKEPPPLSKENMDLVEELMIAKKKLHEQQMKWRRSQFNWAEKVWDGWKQLANTARAVKTSIDLSAVLRQGAFYVLSHPEIAIKSFVPMIKALRSQKFARQVNDEILSRPNARLYQKAGLFLAEQDSAHPTKMEEVYMGRWAEKIPGVGASARAYVTFLNKLRADTFDAALEKFGRNGTELTDQELKDLASFINNATGRADLKKFNSEGISSVFFAPRWVASRFNMLTTYPWKVVGLPTARSKQLDAKLRKHIAGEYARFIVGYGILHSLAMLAFGGDDEDEAINWNPLSSDFGKIRVGNTRLDTTAGMSNAIVFTSRMLTQHTENTKGEVMPLRYNGDGSNMRFGQRTLDDVILSFVRSKLAPIPSSTWNLMQGTNVVGETYKERAQFMRDSVGMPPWLAENPFLQESLGMGVPLSMADFYDAMQEHGVPKATALQLLATFGVSMNTYDTTSRSSDKKGRPKRETRESRPKRPTRD